MKESEYIGQKAILFLERYYDGDITAMLSAYIENDRLSETEIDTLCSFFPRVKMSAINVVDFAIRFLICNVFISGIIGILFDSADIQNKPVQPDAVQSVVPAPWVAGSSPLYRSVSSDFHKSSRGSAA